MSFLQKHWIHLGSKENITHLFSHCFKTIQHYSNIQKPWNTFSALIYLYIDIELCCYYQYFYRGINNGGGYLYRYLITEGSQIRNNPKYN